jgi:hypothetical protein
MGYISGLKESTKYGLAEYCRRNRITQIAWVEKHLTADLANEAGKDLDKKEEAAN